MAAGSARSGPLRIALIGIDGAGKSTAARQLAGLLARRGYRVKLRRNAGGRKWLDNLARRRGSTAEKLLGRRGLSLFETVVRAAALLRTLVRCRPADIEIHDRYLYCQLALNRARECPPGRLLRLLGRVIPAPGLVLYLDVAPERALARVGSRGTDVESLEDLRAFAAGYRSLADFASFRVIDANGSPDEILARVEAALPAAVRAGGRIAAG